MHTLHATSPAAWTTAFAAPESTKRGLSLKAAAVRRRASIGLSCSRRHAAEQASLTSGPRRHAAAMAKTVLALALGSAAAFSPNAAPRATTVVRSDPNIKTDVGSGWKPESGGFSSTDTPDFFYDDDDERVRTQRPISSTGHRRDSCPSHDAVGGLFFDFGAVQYSRSQPHRVISTTRSASRTASWAPPV